jgi:hypothetical protein
MRQYLDQPLRSLGDAPKKAVGSSHEKIKNSGAKEGRPKLVRDHGEECVLRASSGLRPRFSTASRAAALLRHALNGVSFVSVSGSQADGGREGEEEGCPFAWRAFHPNATAVSVDDTSRDSEA